MAAWSYARERLWVVEVDLPSLCGNRLHISFVHKIYSLLVLLLSIHLLWKVCICRHDPAWAHCWLPFPYADWLTRSFSSVLLCPVPTHCPPWMRSAGNNALWPFYNREAGVEVTKTEMHFPPSDGFILPKLRGRKMSTVCPIHYF